MGRGEGDVRLFVKNSHNKVKSGECIWNLEPRTWNERESRERE